ncbi:hypothetical protein XENOCAPTIV_010131 [Xenoophorus captivus]|uniref:Uncharacterized protein n=1 Tax=Xenoophorus captivus TaxID=1517983 RepID=A0ABV0RID8_9TELE
MHGVFGSQNKLPRLPCHSVRGEDLIIHSVHGTISVGKSRFIQTLPAAPRPHGIGNFRCPSGASNDERFLVVGCITASVSPPSSVTQSESNSGRCDSSLAVVKPAGFHRGRARYGRAAVDLFASWENAHCPSVFLPVRSRCSTGHGRIGVLMAERAALCFPSSQSDIPSSSQSEGAGLVFDSGRLMVATEALGGRDNPSSVSRIMAPPHSQGPAVSGSGGDLSSSPRSPGSLGLARERWYFNAAGLPPEVIDTIQNARASSTPSLYCSK